MLSLDMLYGTRIMAIDYYLKTKKQKKNTPHKLLQ